MVKLPMNLTSKTPYVTFYSVQTKKTLKVSLNSAEAKKLRLCISKNGTRLIKYESCSRIVSAEDYKALSKLGVKKLVLVVIVSAASFGLQHKESKTTCEKTGCKWVSGKKGVRRATAASPTR